MDVFWAATVAWLGWHAVSIACILALFLFCLLWAAYDVYVKPWRRARSRRGS